MDWTDKALAILTECVLSGASASIASAKLQDAGIPFSRNACLGKAKRMYQKGELRMTFHSIALNKPPAAIKPLAIVASSPAPVVAAPVDPAIGIPIMQIGFAQCRWPVNDPTSEDFQFCGCTTKSGSYCEFHHKKVYTAARVRNNH